MSVKRIMSIDLCDIESWRKGPANTTFLLTFGNFVSSMGPVFVTTRNITKSPNRSPVETVEETRYSEDWSLFSRRPNHLSFLSFAAVHLPSF